MILLAVCLAVFMLLLDMTIVSSALADLQASLGADLSDLQWVIDAYALPMAGLLLTAATLGDRLGRRRLYLLGMALFTTASLGCALSGSATMLIGVRAVQGTGGAILLAVSLPIIAAAYPQERRGGPIAIYGAVMGAGSAAGPLLGGFLVTHFGWQSIFLVNLPVGVIALIIAARHLPETRAEQTRPVDWVGTMLLTCGLLTGVFAVISLHGGGIGARACAALALCAVVALALFLWWEGRTPAPMLSLRLVTSPGFAGVWVAAAAASGTLIGATNYLALYFMNTLGYNAFETGLRAGPLTLATIAGAPLGILVGKRLPSVVTIPGGVALVAVGLWAATGAHAGTVWTHFIFGSALAGLGLGALSAVTSDAALQFVPLDDAGMATGSVSTGRQIGILLGVAGMGVAFGLAAAGQSGPRAAGAAAINSVLAWGALAAACAAFVSLILLSVATISRSHDPATGESLAI
ncbi:Putative drug resistance transporter [Mycobacteroides abscessus subsp. abscessus]|uniref:MFS transporter n=1 Tax=Mycobacteroides abscessus TaxID=36809 RepID=UPI0009A6770A|nr:MFS transporter [Mycobacteroides abscessus]SLE74966.1 Putative drug resistance transporter [Mycobacteroides abscessus subsp. abscessus]SLF02771.1 Putative drug resistance transporter [Mycobacteroides abscessus subsp. abscessus]SLF16706.1 Putative drug resistance transporter [Mycobacteroides abscessus subsp. abscessus]SLF77652.1 Putative drug resistance transporter [Mycobacteroides abscessus subsp. abscessus]SLH20517.1 Putative drug resistance transporter [Mycobacteroides abscessus subsp. ab